MVPAGNIPVLSFAKWSQLILRAVAAPILTLMDFVIYSRLMAYPVIGSYTGRNTEHTFQIYRPKVVVPQKHYKVPKWLKRLCIVMLLDARNPLQSLNWVWCFLIMLLVTILHEDTQKHNSSRTIPNSKWISWIFSLLVVYISVVIGIPKELLVTLCYFLITEQTGLEKLTSLLDKYFSDYSEGLEEDLVKLFYCAADVLLSQYLIMNAAIQGKVIVGPAFIFLIYLPIKHVSVAVFNKLKENYAVLEAFPHATQEEVKEYNDVCAICLTELSRARKTQCHHLFHGVCLRRCLSHGDTCPLCKQPLREDRNMNKNSSHDQIPLTLDTDWQSYIQMTNDPSFWG